MYRISPKGFCSSSAQSAAALSLTIHHVVLFFARAAPKEPAPEKFVSARSSRSVIEVNEMLGIMQKE